MKKKYLTSLLTMAILATGGGNLQAQTDVTSSYLENPSFELGTDGTAGSTGKGYYSPYQWTATNLPTSGTKNFGIYSANETSDTHPGAFGVTITPDDGDYYFFGRESWNGSFDVVTLSQESKTSLPAGKYLMSISYKLASKANSGGYIEISAKGASNILGSAKSLTAATIKTDMTTIPWDKLSVPFEVTEEGTVTFSIDMHFNTQKANTQQEAMAIDNVKIYDLSKVSKDNGIDLSGLVTNQNFNISTNGWTSTTGAQNKTLATNKGDAFTVPFYENWNGKAVTGKMYTTVNNLPNGIYSVGIAAFVNTLGDEGTQYVYAGDNKVNITSTTPTAYTIENIKVTNGTLELGLEQTVATANWLGVDNVSLTYYGAASDEDLKEAYTEALNKAKSINQESPMNGDTLKALQSALTTYGNVTSGYDEATQALSATTDAANASIAAYSKANGSLEQMKNLLDSTNVYTAEALKTYYTDPKAKYDARTLSDVEANALQNPYTITSWHATNSVDDLLMSAWSNEPENWNSYHVNTWSTEDTNNGFPVPFIEYWTNDASTLADDTLTATVTGLTANQLYKLSARVRVAVSTSKTAPATGITLDVNGESNYATTITGKQIGTSSRYLDTYTVFGKADSNGELKVNFNIKNTNVSWLAFQNVMYTETTVKDLYDIALTNAKTTLADEDYVNVTGTEKTTLQTLVEAAEPTNDEAYTEATAKLNNAVSTFTSAKTAYDNYAANHEAADAIAKALDVETTAPTTAAEATTYFDNLNVAEYNEVAKTYSNDLTSIYDKAWTSNSFGTASGQHWSGEASTSYIDKWSGSALAVTATKTITLPAGKWVIKAAGRSAASASISLTADTTTVAFPAKGDTGYGINTNGTATFSSDSTYANDNKGRGWEWRFIPLTLTEQQEITLTLTANLAGNSWAGFCDLAILADETTASNIFANADDYKAFSEALAAAGQKTLGFDKDEYAPYNNVEALQALATAKAIDTEAKNIKSTITALTDQLGKWTANTEAVDIVYNGNYATTEEGQNYPKGWTRTNGWGQMQTAPVTAYYNQPGSLKYGDRTGYTMPLKANTLYKLTFQYASWENNSNNGMTASVLNADNEGLTAKTFESNGTQWKQDSAFVTATAYFTTGKATDYVLTLTNGGNTVITGVAITEEQSLALNEEATTAPDALTTPVTVTYNRTFKQGWNSIVLPFATTPSELGAEKAVAFTGTEESTIKFVTATSLEANKPYMIYFNEEKTAVTFTNKTMAPNEELTTEDSGNQYDFVGSYVANNAPVAGDYIVVTKGIQKAKGGNAMKAFRAYFKARGEEAGAKAMTITIDGQTTGINAINFNDALLGNEPAYNLAGQRVAKNYKGIVVRNGKKTINK